MSEPIRVLMVEDSENDALLIIDALERGGYSPAWERVDSPDSMATALAQRQWDIVTSDHGMPNFNAPAALELLKTTGQDVPFIIVSGTIEEDIAVGAMKAGASDYIMKDNLSGLVPAIARELRDAEARARERESEAAP
jgi:DNA-binding NtrC family response regulator